MLPPPLHVLGSVTTIFHNSKQRVLVNVHLDGFFKPPHLSRAAESTAVIGHRGNVQTSHPRTRSNARWTNEALDVGRIWNIAKMTKESKYKKNNLVYKVIKKTNNN